MSKQETTKTFFLTRNTLKSNDKRTSDTNPDDDDYDITFNEAQDLKGTVYASLQMSGKVNTGSGTAIFVFTVRHWDGSTETDIATGISDTHIVGTGRGKNHFTVAIPIPTPFHFAKGDTLRINVTSITTGDYAGDSSVDYAHDPANRTDSDFDDTRLEFYVPFALKNT